MTAGEATWRHRRASVREVPLIRPFRGTFSPSKAGEKEKWRAPTPISLRPTQWGEGAPEGRMRGSFSGKHDGRRGNRAPSSRERRGSPHTSSLRGSFSALKSGEKEKWRAPTPISL